MSYAFNGGDNIRGSFSTTYNDPLTLACFLKITSHLGGQWCINLAASNASINDSYTLRIGNTDGSNIYSTHCTTATGTLGTASTPAVNIVGSWAGLVGVHTKDDNPGALRDAYVQAVTNTGTNIADRAIAPVQHISVGESVTGTQDLTVGSIAEVAIWNKALDASEITSYLAGNVASGIAAANLIGYWPLSASSATHANQGLDAGGLLTVTNAVFNSDHPTIIAAGGNLGSRRSGLVLPSRLEIGRFGGRLF